MTSFHLQTLLREALDAHRAMDFLKAKNFYEQFLKEEPYRPDVIYNLALSLIALGEIEHAISRLEAVLEKVPGHADALNNLGALLLKQDQYEQALQCFASVLATQPDHHEARNNMAAALLQLGHYHHAAEHYHFLLEKTPDDLSALYSYGLALIELGEFEEAIIQFQKIVTQNPEHLDAISNIGIAYLKAGNLKKAETYFEEVLKKLPNHPEIRYLYNAMTQKDIPEKPPQQYIQHLFDQYATHYESHVINTLHYDTPKALLTLLQENLSKQVDRAWHILDLGCGTGLSGLAFRHLAKTLTGVDLSQKMLSIAKQKLIYDQLISGDIIDFLERNNITFDLVLAADTFNYFGDLEALFHLCHRALKPKAYFLFSLEALIDSEKNWVLNTSGRYVHSHTYIEKIAQQQHFRVLTIEKSTLREQNHTPVDGFLCLLQRIPPLLKGVDAEGGGGIL